MAKTPLFPTYQKAQTLLQILDGVKEEDFKQMQSSIKKLVNVYISTLQARSQ
jgi:hypothetical protein